MCSQVDHWLDGETHAGIKAIAATLLRWHVRDVGSLVKKHSDAVPHIFVDDSKTEVLFHVRNDGVTYRGLRGNQEKLHRSPGTSNRMHTGPV